MPLKDISLLTVSRERSLPYQAMQGHVGKPLGWVRKPRSAYSVWPRAFTMVSIGKSREVGQASLSKVRIGWLA